MAFRNRCFYLRMTVIWTVTLIASSTGANYAQALFIKYVTCLCSCVALVSLNKHPSIDYSHMLGA